jgi:hypothetical protein
MTKSIALALLGFRPVVFFEVVVRRYSVDRLFYEECVDFVVAQPISFALGGERGGMMNDPVDPRCATK